MTVFVTGANGFVGSAITRRLIHNQEAVRVLVRPRSDRSNLQGLPVETVEGELLDRDALVRGLKGCSRLYHVAADYRLWTPEPSQIYRSNVEGTAIVMEAAVDAGVERVVYTSSVATLGTRKDGAPADEQTLATLEDMVGHYKRSKFLAEAEVLKMVRDVGLPAVICNPSMPVGPGDRKPTPTGIMIRQAVRGKMPAFVDTGLNVVHVDDVATGHLLAAGHGTIGERYILGGDNLELNAILTTIAKLTGAKPPRVKIPHQLAMSLAWLAEIWARIARVDNPLITRDGVRMSRKKMFFFSAKAERDLGYRSRPAIEALRDAVSWFRQLDEPRKAR